MKIFAQSVEISTLQIIQDSCQDYGVQELARIPYVPHINQSRVVQILTGLQNDISFSPKPLVQKGWRIGE